jgi:hypothetical protein
MEQKMIRFVVGLIVTVVSFAVLFGYAIPNVQHAHEVQRQAQLEYDQAILEQEQAFEELKTSIDEINAMFTLVPSVMASTDGASTDDEGTDEEQEEPNPDDSANMEDMPKVTDGTEECVPYCDGERGDDGEIVEKPIEDNKPVVVTPPEEINSTTQYFRPYIIVSDPGEPLRIIYCDTPTGILLCKDKQKDGIDN